jgi:hypothetical protein
MTGHGKHRSKEKAPQERLGKSATGDSFGLKEHNYSVSKTFFFTTANSGWNISFLLHDGNSKFENAYIKSRIHWNKYFLCTKACRFGTQKIFIPMYTGFDVCIFQFRVPVMKQKRNISTRISGCEKKCFRHWIIVFL